MRQTPYHGFTIPEPGDDAESVANAIDELVNEIDRLVVQRDHEEARPAAGDRGRLFLATGEGISEDNPPQIQMDRGDQWVGVAGDYDLPDTLARVDRPEEFFEPVTFERTITVEGGVEGHATSADEADHSRMAEEAKRLADHDIESFLRVDQDEVVRGEWEYNQRQTFESGFHASGGTIDLPEYDGDDPPIEQRQPGSMWFRSDHQPNI